jgi:hypothetical protein
MKASFLLVILLLFPLSDVICADRRAVNKFNLKAPSAGAYWPDDSVVNAYFVRDMFTADERQTLWEAMEAWTQKSKQKGMRITFVLAGEAGGLIDCVRCLTIARQGFSADCSNQRVALNTLRYDEMGGLLSAWIGFERAGKSQTRLRTIMLQVLERALGSGNSESAKLAV